MLRPNWGCLLVLDAAVLLVIASLLARPGQSRELVLTCMPMLFGWETPLPSHTATSWKGSAACQSACAP